jgi:hypothetical protein
MKITIGNETIDATNVRISFDEHGFEKAVYVEGRRGPKGEPKFDVNEIMATTRDNDGYCSRVEVQFESDKHDPTPYMAEIKAKIKAVIESYTV